jgi:uncharacterized membrane protein YcaP (DUF421 family)
MLSETISSILVPHVPVIEKIVRPLVVYLALIVLLRIFGKRELAQLNPFDLVVLLSLSNTVQNAIIGDDNSLSGGLIGAATLLTINYLVVRFVFRHRRLDELLEGSPLVLIEHGEINKRALAKELMSVSELTIVAHRQGLKSLDEVDRCVLEPGGTFQMVRKATATEGGEAQILIQLERILTELKQFEVLRPKGNV